MSAALPNDDPNPRARCPLCDARGAGPVASHTDFPSAALYRCDGCTHFFAWPEPDDEVLARHYEGAYADKRRAYFGRGYRTIMKRRAAAQAALLARYATPPGRALDVGCGIGALVAELAGAGWSAKGIDSDGAAIELGRASFDVDITTQAMADVVAGDRALDLVTLSHVVEHMARVRDSLGRVVAAVRPGGWVFVEVPNQVGSPVGDFESHLNFFSRGSLEKLLRSVGLDVLFCACCGPRAAAPAVAAPSFATRLRRSATRLRRNLLDETEWDGWYDRYYNDKGGDDGAGLWIRAVGVRRMDGR